MKETKVSYFVVHMNIHLENTKECSDHYQNKDLLILEKLNLAKLLIRFNIVKSILSKIKMPNPNQISTSFSSNLTSQF